MFWIFPGIERGPYKWRQHPAQYGSKKEHGVYPEGANQRIGPLGDTHLRPCTREHTHTYTHTHTYKHTHKHTGRHTKDINTHKNTHTTGPGVRGRGKVVYPAQRLPAAPRRVCGRATERGAPTLPRVSPVGLQVEIIQEREFASCSGAWAFDTFQSLQAG